MTHSYRDTLRQPGFELFLWTQFLGAFNDNFFKIVVSMLAVHLAVSQAESGRNLSIAAVVFNLPFLLFSGYAGQLADLYSKRTVLIVTKSLEIVTALLALAAFVVGRLELTLAVLFLFALQATFFSPAKYGILPEMLPERDLSRANGMLEMSTFVAIVIGTAAGSYLLDIWKDRLWIIGVAVVAIAVIGTASSFGIPRVPAAAPGARLRLNPFAEITDGVKRLLRDRVLCLTVIGLSYFFFLGALIQLTTVLFGAQVLKLDDRWIGLLTAFAAIGIGVGSVLAGRLSGDKVELGLAPLGAIGMGIFAILLSRSTSSFVVAAFNMMMVGFFGGLFAVPLNALLQQRSGEGERGRLQATNGFLNMAGVMLASAALWLCSDVLELRADRIFLIVGVLTLISSIYVLRIVPEFTIRFSLWLLTHTIYRIRIVGQENVPSRGPALLVCNHLSLVDGLLVGSCVQRFIRFLVYKPYYDQPAWRWLLQMMHAIPIAAGKRSELMASLERARQELVDGHVVCIFAEGAISRTGNLLPFKRGFERIVQGLDVPVIPVYLDRVWGSIFSFKGGRFFWKWPLRVPYPVTVAFARPLPSSTSAAEARLAMMELGSDVAAERHPVEESLGGQFIRTAKRRWSTFCMADSTGQNLTFGRALVGSLLLSRWIRRHTGDEVHIALLLPASVGGALANVAASLAGKVCVNLNFTAGHEGMLAAVDRCEIRTILTSRTFLTKASIQPMSGMVFIEDVLRGMSGAAKLRTLVTAYVLPAIALTRLYARRTTTDQTAAVIFSSGSTGVPKGVMLSHRNILANVDSVFQIFDLTSRDVIVGVLPLFHSFGFTATLWLPLVFGFGVAYHPNPMDAKSVGEIAQKYKGTFLIATPTFCGAYVRKCVREQFAHLRFAIVGAEKLREQVSNTFLEKFGLGLLEGYGCTEMAPVVAVNSPDVIDGREHHRGTKPGSVGLPIPGVVAKVVDPDTGEGPWFDREGLLLVKGANRMLGYLGEPERTRDVIRDGWYVTGDIAKIDDDGFIFITDRLSRFGKIGGEMVPFVKIEEHINALLDAESTSVVTSVPDESRGERLVAFYTDPAIVPHDLWDRLSQTELPKLWIPKREDLHFREALPTLGSGKVDLRAVRQLALGHTSGAGVT